MPYCENLEAAVGFVNDSLQNSKPDSALTMTIVPTKSGGYYVRTATVTSWDDYDSETAALISWLEQRDT